MSNAIPRSRSEKITRKPLLPPRPHSNGQESTQPAGGSQSKKTTLNTPESRVTIPRGAQHTEDDVGYEDEPPPYNELDFQHANDANELALEELDLNATVDPAAISEDGNSMAEENDHESISAHSQGDERVEDPSEPSKWKAALETTKTFAWNLIKHPVQSTRHYSVLRHSHGLVAYQGLGTHVAITLFADEPACVPPERTIWLQQRGWTGKRGMRMKAALGAKSAWIDVTPAASVDAKQVREVDERSWQRHIATFLRKAATERAFAARCPVETYAVRIPFTASDGYFRLVICVPGKVRRRVVLCTSPIFRIASLSTSSAAFRGASLRTLPLEIGIKALTIVATNAATQGTAPLVRAIQNQFGSRVSGVLVKSTKVVYDVAQSKLEKSEEVHVDGVGEMGKGHRPEMEQQNCADEEEQVTIGSDEGPEPPYPVRFSGKVVQGAGKSNVENGLPTANLSGVPGWFRTRVNGIYFGWVSINQSKTIISDEWRPALIFARPPEGVRDVSPKTVLRVFVIEDFAGVDFFAAKLDILLLGFIRPWEETHPEQFQQETSVDILIARQSLEREGWQPEVVLDKHKDALSPSEWGRFTRTLGRVGVDRVPFERLSIRMPQMEARDGLIGRGGLCINRRSTSPKPQR